MTAPATAAPSRLPWPPIAFLLATAAALGLQQVLPLAWPGGGALALAGWLLLFAALGLDAAAMLAMRRQRTTLLPHRAATSLVTTGPFAWSRNPIYLGNTLAMAGAALAFGNPWFLPAGLLAAIAVTRLAIRPEEAHLAATFGAEWDAYAARTRRWLGPHPPARNALR